MIKAFPGPVSPSNGGPVPDTCGNCRYGHTVQLGMTECHGVPPTPVVLGFGQNLAGQTGAQIELLRARLPSDEAACALHKPKAPVIQLSS